MTAPSTGAVFRIPRGLSVPDSASGPGHGADIPRPRSQPAALLWSAPLSVRSHRAAEAFAREGLAGLSRITGPWAVAVRAGDSILVAHDPTGIMPLYWARLADGGVAVSDHLPTLMLAPGVDATVEPEHVARRYAGAGDAGWLGMSLTDYRSVHAVPPGHAISVAADGSVRQVRFWDPAALASPDESMTPEQAAQALRTALEGAVRRAVAAAVGPGGAPRVGAEWSATTPMAVLAQSILAAEGQGLACLLGIVGAGGTPLELPPAVAGVPFAPLTTASGMHEWTSALDYHRFPSRGRDANVALAVQARGFGLTDIIAGRHTTPLPVSSSGVAAGLLAQGRWRRARALMRNESPTHGNVMLRQAARNLLRDAAPEQVVDALRPLRAWAQQLRGAAGRVPATATSIRDTMRPKSALALSLGREQSARYTGARSARDFAIASWMSGAEQRSIEATWAYLGYFGIRVHRPFLDVEVIETALRIPDSAWAHLDIPGWPYWTAIEPWIGPHAAARRGRPAEATGAGRTAATIAPEAATATRAPEPAVATAREVRTWRENDPAIAAVLAGRPLSTGPTADPCTWGI